MCFLGYSVKCSPAAAVALCLQSGEAHGTVGILTPILCPCVRQISVQIQLSRSGLTRQVYFLPSVVVANNAPYDIQIHEPAAGDDWITVTSSQYIHGAVLGSLWTGSLCHPVSTYRYRYNTVPPVLDSLWTGESFGAPVCWLS